MEHQYCPHCNVDLTGEPIPEEYKEFYGNETHFSRKISIYDFCKDKTVAWQCPDCGKQWDIKY